MGDIAAILPTYYGISERARKERGSYICRTKQSRIIRTSEPLQVIEQRYNLLEQLAAAGFTYTDRIFLSTQNTPCITLGREAYVMVRNIIGNEPNLNSKKDVIMALESIAKFHKTGRNIPTKPTPVSPLFDTWKKNTVTLEQSLKQVHRTTRLSDFDVLFLKNVSRFTELANAAQDALQKTNYVQLQAEAINQNHICHNLLKEENLPIMDGVCHITRLTEPTRDLQLTDLANFIRRYARRSEREMPIGQLIEIYDRVNPLPSTAEEIIRAQLIYPSPFIKTVSQYYTKKRGWTPIVLMSRMTDVLEEQPFYDNYISNP